MKILVMSLLRIGDIIMSTPALKALRDRYPDAEIHLLINSQFRSVTPLIPHVDRVILFDRDRIQKGLGEAHVPLFESYERLATVVDQLNGEDYDIAYNMTHSRLSGWLMSVIAAHRRVGLTFDEAGKAVFGSSWFKYLNNQVDCEGREVFHFADVFRFAVGDEEEMPTALLSEIESGIIEAERFCTGLADSAKNMVVVQALTSDRKKDWGYSAFASALQQFVRVNPEATIVLLGAPFEREKLAALHQILLAHGVSSHLAILSFEGAYSLLRRSRMLISGDTSIKHLGCAARIPVVEIAIGSSDLYRTGAFTQGSVIIRSTETCAPCVHSVPCYRESHACALRIPPDAVAMVASEVYAGRDFQLKAIAEEFRAEIEILRVENRLTGFWSAYSVLEPLSEQTVGRWVDLSSKKMWLNAADSQGRGDERMGSEIMRLTRLLRMIHPTVSDIEWRHLLGAFEEQLRLVEGRLNGLKTGIRYLHGTYEDPKRMKEFVKGLIIFRDKIRGSPLLGTFKTALDQIIEDDISPSFTRFRRIVDVIMEIDKRTSIYQRIVRGLESQIEHIEGEGRI